VDADTLDELFLLTQTLCIMIRKFFLMAVAIVFMLVSCGRSQQNTDTHTHEDGTEHSHDDHAGHSHDHDADLSHDHIPADQESFEVETDNEEHLHDHDQDHHDHDHPHKH
jgi:hypothetical protein